ncbi:acyl-CoA dehydrogenase family protein [Ramlibacter albus]|uniref:Acyl-CoA dehydrogenase family protein n=1 Tax=Ramlibacter albus TaxID=2079448 RepID=A0A923MCY3_9BURK|nr:acyl-CoA dehydrogenase family protein [Ramlibacter albus]MBC5767024.1 acyl-CoA dehydrogenase family protein [Ramlibacter albus]
MDFDIPRELQDTIATMDAFIAAEIKPLEDANPQFFDHRRERARTNWAEGGIPTREWEALLHEMRRRADRAGFYRIGLPKRLGGKDASNLAQAVLREHLAAKGVGLHADLQSETSVVGSISMAEVFDRYANEAQKAEYLEGIITGEKRVAFGLTEPDHGSDATWMETTAVRQGDVWVINGAKRFNSGVHTAHSDLVIARTSGKAGDATGLTGFIVPMDTPGVKIEYYHWTFNMPSDHAEVTFKDVRVPHSAILAEEGKGLMLAQHVVHKNRIRQAAQSAGAARYCVQESVQYARERKTFGKPIAQHQAIQFPLAEMHAEVEIVRNYVFKTAWEMDRTPHEKMSDQVGIANFRANRLACKAADLAMQVHGGIGYTRGKAFEHIYRHHRRYRITEGSDEVQIRKVAGFLFGFAGPNKIKKTKETA